MLQNATGFHGAKDVHLNSPLAYWRVGEGTAAPGTGPGLLENPTGIHGRVGEGTAGGGEELLPPRFDSTASSPVRPGGQDDAPWPGAETSPK